MPNMGDDPASPGSLPLLPQLPPSSLLSLTSPGLTGFNMAEDLTHPRPKHPTRSDRLQHPRSDNEILDLRFIPPRDRPCLYHRLYPLCSPLSLLHLCPLLPRPLCVPRGLSRPHRDRHRPRNVLHCQSAHRCRIGRLGNDRYISMVDARRVDLVRSHSVLLWCRIVLLRKYSEEQAIFG